MNKGVICRLIMSTTIDVHIGDEVEIISLTDPGKFSAGIVYKIFDPESNRPTVLLRNSEKGRVVGIKNSDKMIKDGIMNEDHHNENKETFSDETMRHEVIPQTVQSFLNSDGGNLYVGVKDSGPIDERLTGLDYDFKHIDGYKHLSNDKLCDKLTLKIMDALNKYLISDTKIGPLVTIKYPYVRDIQIAHIRVKRSQKPWFFQHLGRSGKQVEFDLSLNDKHIKRKLDDFYIRDGAMKRLLTTNQEFYKYYIDHFKI